MTRDEFAEIDRAFSARDNAANELHFARNRAKSAQSTLTNATRFYEETSAELRALCGKHGVDPGAPKIWADDSAAPSTAVAEQVSQ